MRNKIFIHIGPHKTASTFLQKHYFPTRLAVNYMGDLNPKHTVYTDFDTKKNILISCEAYAGVPWSGAGILRKKHIISYRDSYNENLIKVANLFPNAELIIAVRRHECWVLSLYKQFLQEGGDCDLKEFYHEKGYIFSKDISWKHRIEFAETLFDNVHLLNFEKIKEEGLTYLDHFFENIGLEITKKELRKSKDNSSIGNSDIETLRDLNSVWNKLPFRLKTVLVSMNITPRILINKGFLKILRSKNSISQADSFNFSEGEFRADWSWVLNRIKNKQGFSI